MDVEEKIALLIIEKLGAIVRPAGAAAVINIVNVNIVCNLHMGLFTCTR